MYNENVIYHIYNQSNNYERLFKEEGNYQYFLQKIKRHLLPYADIFCYCLMPDHFHLMVKPTSLGCQESRSKRYLRATESGDHPAYQQNLSNSLKTLLSSYTHAMNKKYGRRGSLFKAKTKAKAGYLDFIPEAYELDANAPFTLFVPYLRICFYYIHNNPVKAGLTAQAVNWKYSSALDFAGQRNSGICNFALVQRLLGIERGGTDFDRRPTL